MASSQLPNLNYASSYQKELEQAFPYALYYGALYATPNNNRFRWINSKTIEIPSISTSGRTNADRDSIGTAQRNYNNAWTALTLENERKWSTLVHPKDIDQTNYATSIANITKTMNEEHKFPEMDAYCISKIHADWTAAGGTAIATTMPTGSDVLAQFDAMVLAMNNARVPVTGRILYVANEIKNVLKTAAGLTRNWDVQSSGSGINRDVESLDGVRIIPVPQELMMTAYNFSDNNGWATVPSAHKIYMVMIHPAAVITPVSYSFSKLDAPSALTEGKYYYYEESFEDVFVLKNKVAAIQMVVDSAAIAPGVTYNVVANPTGSPVANSYYEVNMEGQYVLSADTVVYKTKTYYTV